MDVELNTYTEALRAAGEPTRLRILALLRQGDLAVGELVQILDQSQPRLSHHLKCLTNAGLVERLPEGAWVFYRAARREWPARLLDQIFADLDTYEGDFSRDMQRLAAVRDARKASGEDYFSTIAEDWDHIRSLHFPNEAIEQAIREAVGPGPHGRLIDLGTGTGRMLTLLAERFREAEGLDRSHHMLTVARANIAKSGLPNVSVRQGDVAATPFRNSVADVVILHQVLHYIDAPETVLTEAHRILKPGGQLLIIDFAPHELEVLRDRHGHRWLGIRGDDIADWAEKAGLNLKEPLRFTPPDSLEQGLSVQIWQALRPANHKEVAA